MGAQNGSIVLGRWALGSTGTEGPSPMGSVVARPPPLDPRLSARHLDEMLMGIPALRGAGVLSPSPAPGAWAEAQATAGPRVPSPPCSFLNIHLAERGAGTLSQCTSSLTPDPSTPLPTSQGPGRGLEARLALPGRQEALHVHGPLLLPLPESGSAQGPRNQAVSFHGEQRGGRSPGRGVQPASPVSTSVPPDCPLLGWSQSLPKSLSGAFWGKELGGLGCVF